MLADIIGWGVLLALLAGFVWLAWPPRDRTYADRDEDSPGNPPFVS